MESVDIPALHGAERTRFRPVAELSGVSSAILATAGAYTTAFGHALNVRGTRDFDALPLDLTVKIPLLLLPSERRDPLTILEQAAGARQRSRSGAQSAEPKNLGGVAAVMYAIALAIMAIGFGVPTARGFFLGRQIRSGVADTLAASARILNAKNIEADAALQAAKHGAISRIQGSRHESQEMLEATARAMVSVPRNLWLTSIQSAGASELRLDGTTREYAAIGLFEDGLRATAAFGPVQLDRVTQHDREWTFSIRATRHIAGGQ
jgi:Tfp pilus assembly protein PilN